MSSNARLSILKPGRPREPLQDLSQLLPTNDDEETTTTDNHKRRVSFACVNKVKEFETEAECTTLRQTPAYDERFSISSDSYQSSILEASHNKSTFISYADASKLMNYGKAYGENIDIVELGLHNVSRGAPSPGRMNGGDSSMDITSVIVRDEHEYTADYESNSESYYPLNLTKSASIRQSMAKAEDPNDKDVLDSSSMETTEALPCMMTETIVTDFETFNQTMDISVEEVAVEEEKNSQSSMNHTMGLEKVFHLRKSTTLLSEKDIQFTVDAYGDVKDSHIQENIFVKKHLISFPEQGSCAMEEDTSIFRMQNQVLDKENDHPLAENTLIEDDTRIEDDNCSQLEETEIVEREMDISFSKSFVPAKETFSLVSNGFEELEDEDTQSAKAHFSLVSNVFEEPKEKNTQSAKARFSLASNVFEELEKKDTQSAKARFSLASNVFEELKEKDIQSANEPFALVSNVFEELETEDVQSAKETFSLVSNDFEESKEKDTQSAVVIEEQEKNALPSENSFIEEKTAEPVEDVFANSEENSHLIESHEEEKKSLPDKSLIVEVGMNISLAESIVNDEEHSRVESIAGEEKEELHSAESSILETKEQSRFVASPVLEEKSPVQPVNDSILEEKEKLQSIQSLDAEEKEPPKSAENFVVEESNSLHEEILAAELQNSLIIENNHVNEKEESFQQDERQIKNEEEIKSIENAISVEENNAHPPEIITSEGENIPSKENIITEKDISQQMDSSVVEMENIQAEVSYENDDENPAENLASSRPLKRKSDSFLPEIPPSEPSPKRHNTEAKSEIATRNETILNQIKKTLQSEIPYWTVVSTSDTEWKFGALWNRLHLVITLSENENKCMSKLRFRKKDSEIGDEILRVAIAPIIRKYRKKMDELCGKVEDVIIFMKITSSSINFAKNFAENFSEIIEFENISLHDGFASFLVANYKTHLLVKIQVDMRNIDDFSDSSIEVKQNIGSIDEAKVRKIFFEARGDFDFFSKFVKKLNRKLNVL